MIRHGLVHNSPGYVCPFCPDQQHKYPRPDNLQRSENWLGFFVLALKSQHYFVANCWSVGMLECIILIEKRTIQTFERC